MTHFWKKSFRIGPSRFYRGSMSETNFEIPIEEVWLKGTDGDRLDAEDAAAVGLTQLGLGPKLLSRSFNLQFKNTRPWKKQPLA